MKTHISPSLVRLTGPAALGITLFVATPTHAVISTDLTAYWTLDNNLTDEAGTYPLAASSVADNAGFSGGSVGFDNAGLFGAAFRGNGGNNGKATVALSNDLSGIPTGSVTVSVWFKATATLTDWSALIAVGEGSAWRVARQGNSNPLKYAYAGGNSDIVSTSTFGNAPTPITTWTHLVAVTEKNVGTRLYLNGVLQATNNTTPGLTTNGSTELWIGGNPNSTNRTWNGYLDDIGIWKRPLTAAEITTIYNEGANNAKSLGNLLAVENLDTDGDGLVDAWEQAYLPPGAWQDNGTVNPAYGPNGDPDDDSSTNIQEFTRKTLPQVQDTDGDGLRDGYENGNGSYASATQTGTNPLVYDTDGDGLRDGVENPLLPYDSGNPLTQPGTSPLLADTDADTIQDGVEAVNASDPTSSGSTPTQAALPITDNFNDGIFDTMRWAKNVTMTPTGAAVNEADGHIRLVGRGHLNTSSQFNPESVGGLYITGKWTPRSDEDFIQILTRSSGTPAGQYGETSTGLEFYLEQTSSNPMIRGRTVDITLGATIQTGKIRLEKNKTFNFTVIDGGTAWDNQLSFRLTQADDPTNSVVVSAQLNSAIAATNYVSFHNREGSVRIADLDDVSISAMTDGDSDDLPDAWETANGLNPLVANTGDSDTDGFTDLEEYQKGTKPMDADTDDDGSTDGEEDFAGTDPLNRDTDSDMLLDGVETNTGIYVNPEDTGTSPLAIDSDSDTLADGVEVLYGLNPSDENDGDLKKGLVSYWTFDNTLSDVAHGSGVGNSAAADNGSFTGAPDVAFDSGGRFGTGILVNGGTGYVTVPKSADTIGGQLTRSVTVSLWAKVNAHTADFQTYIGHGEGSHWRIARNGGGNLIAYAGGSNDINSVSTVTPPTGWIHIVAVTNEGFATKLYINGVLENTGGEPNLDINLASSSNLFIGANPDAANREFTGYLDDVAIWGRALKDSEITQLYQGGVNGDNLGDLVGIVPTNTYSNWIAGYTVGGLTGFEDDADGDGLENGVENLLGTDPSVANAGLNTVSSNATVTTFRHSRNPSAAADISARYQWSKDLATWNNSGVAAGGTTVTFVAAPDSPAPGTTSVTATATGTVSNRLFYRLAAEQN